MISNNIDTATTDINDTKSISSNGLSFSLNWKNTLGFSVLGLALYYIISGAVHGKDPLDSIEQPILSGLTGTLDNIASAVGPLFNQAANAIFNILSSAVKGIFGNLGSILGGIAGGIGGIVLIILLVIYVPKLMKKNKEKKLLEANKPKG